MFGKLFSKKRLEPAEQRKQSREIEHLDRALRVSSLIEEYRNHPDMLVNLVGMIFLVQQDFFRHFGVDLSGAAKNVKPFDMEHNANSALKTLDELCVRHRELLNERKSDGTSVLIHGLAFTACDFWWTDIVSRGVTSGALKATVVKNHLLICTCDINEITEAADQFRGVFLTLPAYEFDGSHWPYRDADEVIKAWKQFRQDF